MSIDINKKIAEVLLKCKEDIIFFSIHIIGITPSIQQEELLRESIKPNARIACKSATGTGKFLANYEKIHTPTGVKEIGDFCIGDKVCNTYSGTSAVTGVYPQGKQHIYRVHFNNGTHVDSGLEHLWTVSTYYRESYRVLSLEEILDKGIFEKTVKSERSPSGRRLRYFLPPISSVYKEKKKVPVDPYTMGVWLGDGTRKSGTVTNIDQEVWDSIPYTHTLTERQTKTLYGFITDLRKTSVWREGSKTKFVPDEYKYNCFETRMEVLRGLMDTDGTIGSRGDLTYYTTSERLRDDFIYLLRSVGGVTKGWRVKKTTHNDCYCVHFQFNRDIPLFKIKRKEDRRVKGTVNCSRVYISSVEYIGEHEATCISVDSKDKLYICENFIPTHNTTALAILIFHQLLTEENINILATSPSAGQLERGLRSELGKLHGMMIEPFSTFFELQRDKVFIKGKKDTHFCSLVTGSAENEESLAGFHADKVIIIVDEASGIAQAVHNILKGNLTTDGSSMVQVSNPQRPSGPFYSLFNTQNKHYKLITLDAFHSPLISKQWIQEIEEEYGTTSDFYKVRVLGEFPSAAEETFIPSDIVEAAIANRLTFPDYHMYPVICGVDVARFGGDMSIFIQRQGPKILDIQKYSGLDTMEVAAELQEYYRRNPKISSIYIDDVGLSAGTFDRAKQLGLPVVGVNVGLKSTIPTAFYNLRAQLYQELKDWLRNNADIPADKELEQQLTSLQYGFNDRTQLQIMTKKMMKKKLGLPSPDIVDALVFTFMHNIFGSQLRNSAPRVVSKANYLWV